ncbi:MAG: DUF2200 domain-containing protein [Defluviitaleaceae bacterium]|nr:DUF2200 domain-containing protein [Defluviitaleaceae bacterium]
MNDDRARKVFKMTFASIYPHYVAKIERKGRNKTELDAAICWLTGYDDEGLESQIHQQATLEEFFSQAPQINPNAPKIKGVICGIRVEEIQDPLMQKIRWMDKLVDELSKGKTHNEKYS